ncbi:MAG: hypothetical protein ACI9J2_000448 [Saprospiraceae bacterium]|jgi:hypothetical protein
MGQRYRHWYLGMANHALEKKFSRRVHLSYRHPTKLESANYDGVISTSTVKGDKPITFVMNVN